jgi:E3 ubiquitin-protein ligase RNF14
LTKLNDKLEDLWLKNANNCILYEWISALNSDLIFTDLKIDTNNIIIDTSKHKTLLIDILINFDKNEKEVEFQNGKYTCNVCFLEYLGEKCIKFKDCQHIFCVECIKSYFEQLIKDDNVKGLISKNFNYK